MNPLKTLFKQEVKEKSLDYSEDEINFRFAAFEAMSLAIRGKSEEAKEKLKESDALYAKLK